MKRILSLLLTAAMLCALLVVPAAAADAEVTFTVGQWTQTGNTGSIPVTVSGASGSFTATSVNASLNFDNTVLTLTSVEYGLTSAGLTAMELDATGIGNSNTAGNVTASYFSISERSIAPNATVAVFHFTVKSDAESGNVNFTLDESGTMVVYGTTSQQRSVAIVNNTCSITGNPPTLSSVTLAQSSVEVVGGSAAAQTIQATAVSQKGTQVTDGAAWSVDPANRGVAVNAGGLVSVDAKAQAGTYTIKAGAKGSTAQGEAQTGLTVTRATPEASVVKLYRDGAELGDADTVVMPVSGGSAKTYTYTAKAFDQYDAEIGAPTWAATGNTDSAHVSFSGGVLTVTDGATKGAAVTLTATQGSASKSVTVTVTDVEVDWSGVSAKSIPYGSKNSAAITLPSGARGTATAGDAQLQGTFAVQQPDAIQTVGSKTVTVAFTVTTAGEYRGVEVTRDFDVAVTKKAVTVKADNQTKAYGEANPALTFTVPSGALVGQDTKDDLAVTLTCAASVTSPAGTPVDITGTGAAANYDVTVTKGALTVTKANIAAITTQAPAAQTVLANNEKNTSLDELKTLLTLPAEAAVSYSGSQTANLPIVWTADKTFAQKGAAYTFTGKVTVNGNFNATDKTLSTTLTVTPVKLTAIEGVPAALTLSKAQVTGAANLAALGLPANVTLKFDGGVADQSVAAAYDKTLANIQTVANSVTATADKSVQVALTAGSFPAWATLEATLPKATLNITNKYVIEEADITFAPINATFGEAYTPAATVADKPEYAGVTCAYAYAKDGKALAAAPTNAGSYTVTVTAENANYKGTKTVALTIAPKTIAGVTVSLPQDFSATYNKAEHKPTVTVTDGETVLTPDKDYTVSYANNVNAGTATVTVIGKGNYDAATTATADFTIAKAPLAQLKPTVAGSAQAGKVLSAKLAGVAGGEITWVWTVGGEAIMGKTDSAYTVALTDSNKAITVKAAAVGDKNYEGETLASEAVTVAKVTVTGSVTVAETANAAEGEAGKIEAGDTLTATVAVTPAVEVTYQWYNNGAPIEDATEAAYTVREGDGKLTVTATPGEDYIGSLTSAAVEVGKTTLTGSVTVEPEGGAAAVDGKLTATVDAGAATEEDYTVTWLRDGVEISGANGLEYTVTKADQGKTITVKVTATGDSYTGQLVSAPVSVPAAKPDAPTVRASAGNGQVTLSWTAPADNGSPITKYTVQMGGEAAVDVTADTTGYTFTGLTNGTEYAFKVCAVNAVGTSDVGEASATPKAASGGNGGGSVGGGTAAVEEESKTEILPDGTKVTVTTSADGEITAQVTVPARVEKTKLTIPAKNVTPGTVAVIVREDGTEEIVRACLPTEDGVTLILTESATVKLLDNSGRFEDMFGHWGTDSVAFVTARELFRGVSDTRFDPSGDMTRGMLVTVLYRLNGTQESAETLAFTDVEDNSWYTDAVSWAASTQVVEGVGDDQFAPDRSVTREQICTMVYRYAAHLGLDVTATTELNEQFGDADRVSTWAADAVKWAVANGLVNGKGGQTLDPTATASRAEVAAIMERFVEFMMK